MRTRALFVLAAAFMAAFLIPTLFAGATPGPATRFPTPIVATTTTSTTTPPSFCHDGACHPLNGTGFVTDGSPQQDDEHCVGTIVQRLGCMAARRHQSIAAMLAPYQPIIVQTAAVTSPSPAPSVGLSGVWHCIFMAESGGDWHNKRNPSYRGGLQFSWATWRSVGGSGDPADASPAEQLMRAEMLQARSGWGQWSTHSLCGV